MNELNQMTMKNVLMGLVENKFSDNDQLHKFISERSCFLSNRVNSNEFKILDLNGRNSFNVDNDNGSDEKFNDQIEQLEDNDSSGLFLDKCINLLTENNLIDLPFSLKI